MKTFKALAVAGLMLCAAGPAAAAPAPTIAQEVASFVQPTREGRLAALKALLDAHGLPYEVQSFEGGRAGTPQTGYNVVVTLGKGDKDILLTAHYDAVVLKDGTLVDGVVDNAASVVALVRAADALKGKPLKRHRLRIVFFDQEELGLLGAKAYAAGPDAARVAGVINFDINAYGDTPFFAMAQRPEGVFLDDVVLAGCKAARESCRPFEVYPPSDHRAFWLRYIPATSFSYLPKDEAEALDAFMLESRKASRNQLPAPRALSLIHTPNDKMAEVDPATVERAAKLAVAVAKAFDKVR